MQASLPTDLVPLGATNLLTIISTSCAIFLAIGQAVFDRRLIVNLSQVVDSDTTQKIISVGATRVRDVVSAVELPAVLEAYSSSATQVFVSLGSCLPKESND
jgi:ABC-type methionine transport system permease subunit